MGDFATNRHLPPGIEQALKKLNHTNDRSALSRVYGRLPDTTCQRRGLCCGLLPPVQHIELLVWLSELIALPIDEARHQAVRLVEHFLFNAAQRRECPWLEPGRCSIYPRRFLGCRAYGLWSPTAYEQRRSGAVDAARQTAKAWASMGVKLPSEVLAPGPEYCRCVRPIYDSHAPKDGDLDRLEDDLADMADGLPGEELFSQWGGDISYAAAWLALGPQKALSLKVAATKACLAGDMKRADRITDEALERTGDWISKLLRS